MNDHELLELAAKAAGMVLLQVPNANQTDADWWAYPTTAKPNTAKPWNPLTDDGDALRLAVRLNILTYQTGLDGAYASTPMNWSCVESNGIDQCAKTRRAIVRAAAEIGAKL